MPPPEFLDLDEILVPEEYTLPNSGLPFSPNLATYNLYRKLGYLLSQQDFVNANIETIKLIVNAGGYDLEDYIHLNGWAYGEMEKPCSNLRVIDHLWSLYSNGRLGFTSQVDMLLKEESPVLFDPYYTSSNVENSMGDLFGWKIGDRWTRNADEMTSLLVPSRVLWPRIFAGDASYHRFHTTTLRWFYSECQE